MESFKYVRSIFIQNNFSRNAKTFSDRNLQLSELSQFVRPEPVRSSSFGFSRDGSRNPLLSSSGGHVSIVPESSTESEKSGLPPRPRRLFRSKRIYEEQESTTKENAESATGKSCFSKMMTCNNYQTFHVSGFFPKIIETIETINL